MYAYATLTAPAGAGVADGVARFVDRLQGVAPRLPLRVVPLDVQAFTPVQSRLSPIRLEAWTRELDRRFGPQERSLPIADVVLRGPEVV